MQRLTLPLGAASNCSTLLVLGARSPERTFDSNILNVPCALGCLASVAEVDACRSPIHKLLTNKRNLKCASQVLAAARGLRWQEAVKLWRGGKIDGHYDAIAASAAITACGRAKRTDWAVDLLAEARLGRHPLDATVLNCAITACELVSRWSHALLLLAQAKRDGPLPDVVSYNAAISSCKRSAKWEVALGLLSAVVSNSLAFAPNETTFNASISACERASRWEWAVALFASLCFKRFQPDVISYSSTISACGRAVAWQVASLLFTSMRGTTKSGVAPNAVTFGAMICAYGRSGRWNDALTFLASMRMVEVAPTLVALSAAISACEVRGQWVAALQLLAQAFQLRFGYDTTIFNAAISACEKAVRWEYACALLSLMGELQATTTTSNLVVDAVSYGATLSACGAATRWCMALAFMAEASIFRIAVDNVALAAALVALEASSQQPAIRSRLIASLLSRTLRPRTVLTEETNPVHPLLAHSSTSTALCSTPALVVTRTTDHAYAASTSILARLLSAAAPTPTAWVHFVDLEVVSSLGCTPARVTLARLNLGVEGAPQGWGVEARARLLQERLSHRGSEEQTLRLLSSNVTAVQPSQYALVVWVQWDLQYYEVEGEARGSLEHSEIVPAASLQD